MSTPKYRIFGEEVEVKFRLTYDGPLPCNSSKKEIVGIKHQIRQHLHPQLADLCERTPDLQAISEQLRGIDTTLTKYIVGFPPLEQIGKKYQIDKFHFVPLIVGAMHTVCHLDILFMRRENPGSLISKPRDEYGGDLDNRLKIFFDALRVPQNPTELPSNAMPDATEAPFYCLLEDDSLITKFQVESDTLLGTAHEEAGKHVRLVIQATIILTQYTSWNRQFSI